MEEKVGKEKNVPMFFTAQIQVDLIPNEVK
jgi:hypothetical protein